MAVAVIAPVTGNLPATLTTLFTAAGDCFVRIRLVNPGGNARAVALYVNGDPILDFTIAAGSNWPAGATDAIFLTAGDTIDGEAAAADEIGYLVTGVNL